MKNKQPEDMTPDERKKIKIEFAPGAFDSFDGTQEELDNMIAEIRQMVASGDLFEKARPVDIDELLDSDDPDDQELAQKIIQSINIDDQPNRKLQ